MNWMKPRSFPTLNDHEVHLWLVDLTNNRATTAELYLTLSTEEKCRANKLKGLFAEKYIYCKAILREILSKYLVVPPHQLQFHVSSNGKPFIDSRLQFNISHSNQLALFAIAKEIELGVDIECKRPIKNLLDMCDRYFSGSERDAISELSPEEGLAAFFEHWVKKEAHTKAIGGRLLNELSRLKKENLQTNSHDYLEGKLTWSNEDYTYALVAKRKFASVRYFIC